ncbi:gliding motility-associated ABC transporter substrate-binding protein GldG [Agriterribacter sp.]|uniref:gliding motility-associated ABC transporter substrate-binding protein GldG n=1 Tax=Agriterribacter sp. TaxID=2821509 RepID=UPI002C5CFADD|nr:gliding motility-associated ABC transporter substrate-binding protein GldG [Agriterribacter sp.]HTN05335.1 gliding motility-associated ABC transporter substrate-binding protein GldG [Agriterribacter sp.]
MKKLLQSPYSWIYVIAGLVLINWVASQWHTRLDLTAEKRYTISPATRALLQSLDEQVTITVLLDGDLPAGFKKLAGSTQDMLQEFREISGNNIRFFFRQPGQGMNDTLKAALIDSLHSMGINPTNVRARTKEGEGEEQRLVYPGVVFEYKDRVSGADLLQGQSSVDGINSLNNAEALLEYKLAGAIDRIKRDKVPVIAYLTGNGQPQNYEVYDLIEKTLKPNYGFSILPVDSVPVIPAVFDALLIVKPLTGFSETQKLKIDQYIMRGGKVVWMIDKLYASLDSLQRSQGSFIAFEMGLNLDDLLFKYGVRINSDLVQDLNCTQIPLAVGSLGNRPQLQLMPWVYFPLLSSPNDNPISKNLDYVLSQFPQSIDTVKAEGIDKTILLASSVNTRILSTPAMVELNSVKNEEDMKAFTTVHVPVAVLLEGKFSSLFTNRISSAAKDSLSGLYKVPFRSSVDSSNKMIVISDGDVVTNFVSQEKGPLQMGENPFTHYQYANKEFFLNCMEYLVGNPGILETRGKDYTLRLLDKKKVDESKSFWQALNILLPVVLVILFGLIYAAVNKRRYAGG